MSTSAASVPPPAPPAPVLAAFEVAGGTPRRLPGGRGTSWSVAVPGRHVVLKPVGDALEAEEVRWVSEALSALPAEPAAAYRLAASVPSTYGGWVVDGWRANRWVAGKPGPVGRWDEVRHAGAAFHTAVAHLPEPPFLRRRQHRWARADRAAWGEEDLPLHDVVAPWAARLRALAGPTREAPQLVHGDLSGNTLFAVGIPPAIIDVSPYWRPAAYAIAIAVADALLWHGEGRELLRASGRFGARGVVARALLFRLLDQNEFLLANEGHGHAAAPSFGLRRYARAVAVLEATE